MNLKPSNNHPQPAAEGAQDAPPRISTQWQRELISKLGELVSYRAKAEVEIESTYRKREATLAKEYKAERAKLVARFEKEETDTEKAYRKARKKAKADFEAEYKAIDAKYRRACAALKQEGQQRVNKSQNECQAAHRAAVQEYELEIAGPIRNFRQLQQTLDNDWQQLQMIEAQAFWVLDRRRCRKTVQPNLPFVQPAEPAADEKAAEEDEVDQQVARLRKEAQQMQDAGSAEQAADEDPVDSGLFDEDEQGAGEENSEFFWDEGAEGSIPGLTFDKDETGSEPPVGSDIDDLFSDADQQDPSPAEGGGPPEADGGGISEDLDDFELAPMEETAPAEGEGQSHRWSEHDPNEQLAADRKPDSAEGDAADEPRPTESGNAAMADSLMSSQPRDASGDGAAPPVLGSEPVEPFPEDVDPWEHYQQQFQLAVERLRLLSNQFLPRLMEGDRPYGMFFVFLVALVPPTGLLLGWNNWQWIACSFLGALALTLLMVFGYGPVAVRQSLRGFESLQEARRAAMIALNEHFRRKRGQLKQKLKELAARRDEKIAEADQKKREVQKAVAKEHKQRMSELTAQFQPRLDALVQNKQQLTAEIKAEYLPRMEKMASDHKQALEQFDRRHQQEMTESRELYEREWNELVERWKGGVAEFTSTVNRMNDFCAERFPDLSEIDWEKWQPPRDMIPALRFGEFDIGLENFPKGIPEDERLAVERTDFTLPAVLSFPEQPSLLVETSGRGRDRAIDVLQNVMLRFLTSLPPGKVRFTIVDPTGLGQNFSAFMHLADYDERLVNMRIWTETTHINQRLGDLTEHMENVIQKYLRNEFDSIEQYNQHAGEVAEPFQVLVVANFPANFTEEGARRLVSIATSGARCGVYTLVSVDTKLNLPRNFDLGDLEKTAATLIDRHGRLKWKDIEWIKLPLRVDMPPEDAYFTAAVKASGREAQDSNRVEVPFASVMPEDGRWWTEDSRTQIAAPIGRAGATKLQYVRLGSGTSQHVLVAGKTGSGKSTLLHALVTSLAIRYSPDQMQFYLVDFKKGVEFKSYARFQLPHARVVAIESEREFGISVLERLDRELRNRGDLFRDTGVQNVEGYRNARPGEKLPRILLIIDEFQELFVKDDRIAQDASLLLDRLVRQGRAFGIHVLLGSQTLAGAYSLARSTIGQMAVRIALQCSESDAHLILSEDNTAARLLSRPGEAIYNDANGLFEGNNPFQVVWLPDQQRDSLLKQVVDLARERKLQAPPLIVFEGNVPADPAENELLRATLTTPVQKHRALAPRAWLGAAVAIKEPTSATFQRHGGSNMLIVGQQEELALGVLSSSIVSLAAHRPVAGSDMGPTQARFHVLDGIRPDAPEAGYWEHFASASGIAMQVTQPSGCGEIISEINREVQRRVEVGEESASPIYLVIHNLARFRDLRKTYDEIMFSLDGGEKPVSAAKLLSDLMREGPTVGVHTLIWCDSYNNTVRWLDREGLRDLELRVLFQVSLTDSSNLIDSPIAGRLGQNRGVLYIEERGHFEKFRPYGPPEDEWLQLVRQQLTVESAGTATTGG